ncbi:MAG: tetratricopeptide repeat protein [Candidatus Gracilibacteria bacterium]
MKNKKLVYIYAVIVVMIIVLIFVGFFLYGNNKKSTVIDNNKVNTNSSSIENTEISKEYIKSKLDIIKNRVKVKDIISKGDNYFENEQLGLAIIQYKIALTKNLNDYKLIEKIGDIYFAMKNFNEAKSYYLKLINNNNINFDNNKYILSVIFSADLTKKTNFSLVKKEITQNVKDKEKVFFYTNSIYCLEDFHLCKKIFDEKIITEKDTLKSEELIEIKNISKTYKDFGYVDLYYKNTLIIGTFMKLKLYPIAITLSKELLKEKEDYKALIQIIAQSYFELGDYKNSYEYLKKYFEQTPTDSNAAYMLGILDLKLQDYILSNIFLNKASYLGYKDTLNIKRKIAYNYYMLGEKEKMYTTFDDIIKTEKEVTKDDINIMINYAIENQRGDKAYEWTKIGLKLFPKESLFYAYMGKLEFDTGKQGLAILYVKKGLELDKNNQLLNYLFALINKKENKMDEAKTYFQKAYNANKTSSLANEIEKELENL